MNARDCASCAHLGCCDDLHYCGGSSWAPARPAQEPPEPDPQDAWEAAAEAYQHSMDRTI